MNPLPPSRPTTAVVLSCAGAPDGDLNVVRALGREGIPVIVVSETIRPPVALSRYCREFHHWPGMTRDPDITIPALVALARRLGHKPVLFPTADPDLQLTTTYREILDAHFRIPIACPEHVRAFTDKREFARFAAQHGFPVPATYPIAPGEDICAYADRLVYPVIVKPANTLVWAKAELERIVGSRKAIVTSDRAQFLETCRPLVPYAADLIVQRYIPGGDDQYFDLQAYFDRRGNPAAWFTGKKVRTSPPAVGAGCCVDSLIVDRVAEIGLTSLKAVGYTGLVDMDFKRDPETGEFLIIEINPRTAAWGILPTACGTNFPFLAYADTTGLPVSAPGKQNESFRYLHFGNDLRAFLQYRRTGEWSALRYIRSLFGRRLVCQLFTFDDLKPFLDSVATSIAHRWRRLLATGSSRRLAAPSGRST